jgi:hypothetical protein
MLRPIVFCLLGWLLLAAGTSAARADGGALRASRQCGDYRVSVFTSPTPLRAGPVDVSVLVQDAATGEVQHDLPVAVTVDDGRQTEQLRFTVEAADRAPPWQTLWPWFTWPALVIVLFALRRTRPLSSRA